MQCIPTDPADHGENREPRSSASLHGQVCATEQGEPGNPGLTALPDLAGPPDAGKGSHHVALFRIGECGTEGTAEEWVETGGNCYSRKAPVDRFGDAPRFWDFRPGSKPDWRTGLFRYIPDDEAEAMWEAVQAQRQSEG